MSSGTNKERIEQNNNLIQKSNTKISDVTTVVNTLSGLTKTEYNACLTLANSIDNLDDYVETSATAEDIREGKTAYSNGEKIVGIMKSSEENNVVINSSFSGIYNQTAQCVGLVRAITKITGKLTISNTADTLFEECRGLIELGEIEFVNVTSTRRMFMDCISLVSAPELDTSQVTNMEAMCSYCDNLVNIPLYDTSNVTTMSNFVVSSPKLSDESLNNIMQMCINATKLTTKTLKYVGMSSYQATRCQSLSNYQALLDARLDNRLLGGVVNDRIKKTNK